MEHSFDVEIAKQYGIAQAIILKYIFFWCEKNRANNANFHDGKYWTYNSIKALTSLFPYMTENKIRLVLKKLKEEGLIEIGNFNSSSYDRTMWYALSEKGRFICENSNFHLLKCKLPFVKK